MATMKQLDDQIGKLQIQRDNIMNQVNAIEKQEVILRKQLLTANPAQKTTINNKLMQLTQQKLKLTGDVAVQSEDVAIAAAPADGTSVGGNPDAPMGADDEMSTSSIGGKFPQKMFTPIGKRRENYGKVGKYVDRLGSKGNK